MNIQWLKFGILIIIAIINFFIGFFVYKKNISKNKAQTYFSFTCFSAFFWIIFSSITQITKNQLLFLWADRSIYFFTTLIIFFFWLFTLEFLYKYEKIKSIKNIIIIIITTLILFITLSNFLITGNYILNGILYQKENKLFNLIYGLYFILLFLNSSYIITKKYINSSGINKRILSVIILGTMSSLIMGIIFSWYLPYIGKHHLYWIGTLFTVPMNLSITYLLFKRD